MLIEFSVANFRSFRERQTLSMVAAPRLHKRANVFEPALADEKFPALLKACVIYGPNASGKSNLLRALGTIGALASRQPVESMTLPVSPFRFDAALQDQPSVFEVHFVAGGMRYQFDLSLTSERIVSERLTAYPKGEASVLYERQLTSEGDSYDYEFDPELEAEPDLLRAWRQLTPPQSLFIAQAVANSAEGSGKPLRQPFAWLKGSIRTVMGGMTGLSRASQELAKDGDVHAADIASFLQDVDVPVSRIRVSDIPNLNVLESTEVAEGQKNALMARASRLRSRSRTTLTHTSALGEADIDYEDESEGTKNLIGFWLPWITRASPLEDGKRVLVVDELDSSLHPKIVSALVAKHLSSQRVSQLIFTTHDTHLMDAKLLRRDQFWIAERDANGATQLRSIHDFEGREGEDIEKRYYAGRYRGLPIVSEG